MRFHLWRKSDRMGDDRSPEHPPAADKAAQVDVDLWAQLAQGEMSADGDPTLGSDPDSLRMKLLAVLADEHASLVPPSAGVMTIDQWNELTDAERERFRRRQLRRIDPRFVPSATSNLGSRSTRVYR